MGACVQVVMSQSATRFLSPLTFHSLTGQPVITSLWDRDTGNAVKHISLAEAADIIIIAPATANTVAKLASGIADDVISCTVLATRAPVIIAPAMNVNMLKNPVTQNNLSALKALGFHIVEPEKGRLASGIVGEGRLASLERIEASIRSILGRSSDLLERHIVVTAGGTQEPIDPVRHIGNRASGKMGFALAEAARDRGARVTVIAATSGVSHPPGIDVVPVRTALEMKKALNRAASKADAVIMAAAVSDYKPMRTSRNKIKKEKPTLTLKLMRIPDIIGQLRGDIIRIGFAAESENIISNARQKLVSKNLDMIVANDITARGSGFGSDTNQVIIIDRHGNEESLPLLSKRDVADRILDRMVSLL
ncbi:MAG: bifunctional phosphopantothenoylcysteine decarboxylase/phosphopantothenate--cysteine ligase CoaBC [Dehalococcoidales bacterium]